MKKSSKEIRDLFISFWKEEPRNSKEIPSSSLVPQNDSTLLFVNSGMFPLVPYLNGIPHPLGKRIHNIQRCVRTNDIDEVGDNRHLVMFEMIGNWSLGDFDKTNQIPWIMEFFVEKCGLDPFRIFVSVFAGDESAPKDDTAIETWKKVFAKYGIKAEYSDNISKLPKPWNPEEGVPEELKNWKYRIFPYSKKKNWWSRAEVPGEIGGPTSEIFYDMGRVELIQDVYHINDDSGRFIEIGNNVFMEYKLDQEMKWVPLEQKNIDFGGGLERIVLACQNISDPYKTDLFQNIIFKTETLAGKKYELSKSLNLNLEVKSFRVLAEHIRSSVFLLGDGVTPSNKDQGYILRRLIRRMIRHAHLLKIQDNFTKSLANVVIDDYADAYPHLSENREKILEEIEKEEIRFRKTLENGLNNINKLFQKVSQNSQHDISPEHIITKNLDTIYELNGKKLNLGEWAFYFYETYGFPPEMFLEELSSFVNKVSLENYKQAYVKIDDQLVSTIIEKFKYLSEQHRINSKASAEKKFLGGLADTSDETTKLHTAHHLLLAAIQKLLNKDIKQRGSNITSQRLRMDFNFDRKLTQDEIEAIENLVNQKIEESLPVFRLEMPKVEAEKLRAQMEFGQRYPEIVSVYIIGNIKLDKEKYQISEIIEQYDKVFSIEFCAGPHVSNTSKLSEGGKKFKVFEHVSIGANLKRIKAGLISVSK